MHKHIQLVTLYLKILLFVAFVVIRELRMHFFSVESCDFKKYGEEKNKTIVSNEYGTYLSHKRNKATLRSRIGMCQIFTKSLQDF